MHYLIRFVRALVHVARSPGTPPPRGFDEVLTELAAIEYPRLTDTGDPMDLPDYNNVSMFHHRDPILELRRAHSRRDHPRLPSAGIEATLNHAIERLVIQEALGEQEVRLDKLSGLAAAKDRDWGTLQAYGDQLTPRSEWGNHSSGWYGFETEADWQRSWGAVLQEHTPPTVYHRIWDDRWFFMNHGTSHRLAAAARQDREQGRGTVFTARVYREYLDSNAAETILRSVIGIYLDARACSAVTESLSKANINPLLSTWSLRPDSGIRTLWLTRSDPRTSRIVSALLDVTKPMHVYNVTEAIRRATSA